MGSLPIWICLVNLTEIGIHSKTHLHMDKGLCREDSMRNRLAIYETSGSIPAQGLPVNAGKALNFAPEPLLDTDEAAAMIKIHPKTLQKLARHGGIRGIRVGKLWRFRVSDIQHWLANQ